MFFCLWGQLVIFRFPKETVFLKKARLRGNKTMNGKMMFLWQAQIAFKMWTNVCPKIDDEVIKLLD